MTAFYTVLEVIALIAVIILPLFAPSKKKDAGPAIVSNLSVNEKGFLELTIPDPVDHVIH